MNSTRRYALTKQDLIDNGYFVEGEKVFKNYYSKKLALFYNRYSKF